MRILFLDTTIHGKLIGGGHLFLPPLLSGLLSLGHELHLVTQGTPNIRVYDQLLESGVTIHSNIWDSDQYVERSVDKLARWVNELNPDVFVISVSADIGWVVLPLLNANIATVSIGHTDDETFYLPVRHYHRFLTKAIGVSHEICANYISTCNLVTEQVEWIPYGVSGMESSPSESTDTKLKIIYAGRIAQEQKRIFDIVEIVKGLKRRSIGFELRVIGDGPDMNEFIAAISDEISSGTVIMMGWQEKTVVREQMQASHVFLLTSEYEGFCIALVEAMANGCCPVVSNIKSGNGELVEHGSNGFLIEVGNIELYLDYLQRLFENGRLLDQLRKSSWEQGKKFNIPAMVANYNSIFLSARDLVLKNRRVADPNFPLMSTCVSKYPFWVRELKVLYKKARKKLIK